MTKTGTWDHPIAMLCSLQTRDKKLRHREGIQRSRDGRGNFLQVSLQKTQIEPWVLYQLVTKLNSQIFVLSVGQHMRPTRNSNQGRRTTHSSHNWPEQWQVVCGITGEAVCIGHGNSAEAVLLPRSHESRQCQTTLLELETVQMVSLSPTNHAWQNSG